MIGPILLGNGQSFYFCMYQKTRKSERKRTATEGKIWAWFYIQCLENEILSFVYLHY